MAEVAVSLLHGRLAFGVALQPFANPSNGRAPYATHHHEVAEVRRRRRVATEAVLVGVESQVAQSLYPNAMKTLDGALMDVVDERHYWLAKQFPMQIAPAA